MCQILIRSRQMTEISFTNEITEISFTNEISVTKCDITGKVGEI